MLIIYIALGVVLGLVIFSNLDAILELIFGISKIVIIGVLLVGTIACVVLFITSGAFVELMPMILMFGGPLILILLYMLLAILLEKKSDPNIEISESQKD